MCDSYCEDEGNDAEIKMSSEESKLRSEPAALNADGSDKVTKNVMFSPEELKTENESPKTFSAVIWKILQDSSVYAVSKFGSSSTWHHKVMWALVLTIGLAGCSYQINRFLTLYFQYPVVISLQVQNEGRITFPAVSVCNLNRIQKSLLQGSDYCKLFEFDEEECSNRFAPSDELDISSDFAPERMNFATCSGHQSGEYSDFDLGMQKFLNAYHNMPESELRKLGHQPEDLIKSCRFNGEPCSKKNFSMIANPQYGNCFTFNGETPEHTPILVTQTAGSNSGLELDLDVQADEYTLISREVGARVVVHHPTSDPNPEYHGIDVAPGHQVSIAIREISIRRLPHPYKDNCRVYDRSSYDFSKNQQDCIRRCIQEQHLLKCNCVDPSIPGPRHAPLCLLSNQTDVCCLDAVLKNISDYGLPCECPLPCEDIEYEMTLSSSVWPSEVYFKKFMGHYKDTSFRTKSNDSGNNRIADFRRNRVKLKIYYQTLERRFYDQEPMYQDSELFSHLGGQMGLWLGLSIVAAFECIEGLLLLIQLMVKSRNRKEKSSTP